jgi:hypothetical protein
MWEFTLIELLTYYSWPFIDIHLKENNIFTVFIKIIHIFIELIEWGGGPTFLPGLGSISPLRGPA